MNGRNIHTYILYIIHICMLGNEKSWDEVKMEFREKVRGLMMVGWLTPKTYQRFIPFSILSPGKKKKQKKMQFEFNFSS